MKLTAVTLLVLLGGAGVWGLNYYFKVGGYDGDIQKLVEGSGIDLSSVSCEATAVLSRKLVCKFSSTNADISALTKWFGLMPPETHPEQAFYTKLDGRRLFLTDTVDPCNFIQRIQSGEKYFVASWRPSRREAHSTTYSGAAMLVDDQAQSACHILDIAYG